LLKENAEEQKAALQLAMNQFQSSFSMTDHYAAHQKCLVSMDVEQSIMDHHDAALQKLYNDAEGDSLVIDKWFTGNEAEFNYLDV
jgi:hypothetical protein